MNRRIAVVSLLAFATSALCFLAFIGMGMASGFDVNWAWTAFWIVLLSGLITVIFGCVAWFQDQEKAAKAANVTSLDDRRSA